MATDTTFSATPVCACSIRASIPTFDRQATKAAASTGAQLVKQRADYLTKPPAFSGNIHTLYAPLAVMITPWDTYINSVSWQGAGGLDEAVEIQNAAGQTIWRGMAQAVDDSHFACVTVGRLAIGGYKVPVLDSGRLDVQIGRTLRNAPGGQLH